jgi:AcrR family transcriptional regulator
MAKTTSSPAETPRRTQAERRATTKAALLDAALVSLGEDGYANMTTRRVAERAGVSQGTQQHYWSTKAEFVFEAMRYATEKLAADARTRLDLSDIDDPRRHEALLDTLWRIHQSDTFKASMELWVAARTDTELRANLVDLEKEITGVIGAAAKDLLPDAKRRSGALEILDLAMAAVRGFAMLAPVVPDATLERRWKIARRHIAASLRAQLD